VNLKAQQCKTAKSTMKIKVNSDQSQSVPDAVVVIICRLLPNALKTQSCNVLFMIKTTKTVLSVNKVIKRSLKKTVSNFVTK
jgi:hypothetical protein